MQRCRVRLHNPFLLLLFIALVVYLAFSIIQTIQGGDAELSSAVRLTLSLMAVNLLILVGGGWMPGPRPIWQDGGIFLPGFV